MFNADTVVTGRIKHLFAFFVFNTCSTC